MSAFTVELGTVGRDRISGLTGVVYARAEYLYGEPQVMLVPKGVNDGAPIIGTWLPAARVEEVREERTVGLINGVPERGAGAWRHE